MCAESSPVNYVTMPGLQRWKWGRFPARVPGDGNEAAGIKSVQNTAIPMDSLWTPYGLPMDSLWTPYGLPTDSLWNNTVPPRTPHRGLTLDPRQAQQIGRAHV